MLLILATFGCGGGGGRDATPQVDAGSDGDALGTASQDGSDASSDTERADTQRADTERSDAALADVDDTAPDGSVSPDAEPDAPSADASPDTPSAADAGADSSADADADGGVDPGTSERSVLDAPACPLALTPLRGFEAYWPRELEASAVSDACGLRYYVREVDGEPLTMWRAREAFGVVTLQVQEGEAVRAYESYLSGGDWFEASAWTGSELQRFARWGQDAEGRRSVDAYERASLPLHWSIREDANERVVASLGGAFRRFAHRQAERLEREEGRLVLRTFESFPYGLPSQVVSQPLAVESVLEASPSGGMSISERGTEVLGVRASVEGDALVVTSVSDPNETARLLEGGALDDVVPYRVSDTLGVGHVWDTTPTARYWGSPTANEGDALLPAVVSDAVPRARASGYWRHTRPVRDGACVVLPRAVVFGYPDDVDLYDLGAPVGERSEELAAAYGVRDSEDLDGSWVGHDGGATDLLGVLGMAFDEGAIDGINPKHESEVRFDAQGRPLRQVLCTTLIGADVIDCAIRSERTWTYADDRLESDTVWWTGTALVTAEVEGVTLRERVPAGPHGRRLRAERDREGRLVARVLEEWEANWPGEPERAGAWVELARYEWEYDDAGRWVRHRIRRPSRIGLSPTTPSARALQVTHVEVFRSFDSLGRQTSEGTRTVPEREGESVLERRWDRSWEAAGTELVVGSDGLRGGPPLRWTETTEVTDTGAPSLRVRDEGSDGTVDRLTEWSYGADGRLRGRTVSDGAGEVLESERWVYGCDAAMSEEPMWPGFRTRPPPPRFPAVSWTLAPWESP